MNESTMGVESSYGSFFGDECLLYDVVGLMTVMFGLND
jgi:hypothetical protein